MRLCKWLETLDEKEHTLGLYGLRARVLRRLQLRLLSRRHGMVWRTSINSCKLACGHESRARFLFPTGAVWVNWWRRGTAARVFQPQLIGWERLTGALTGARLPMRQTAWLQTRIQVQVGARRVRWLNLDGSELNARVRGRVVPRATPMQRVVRHAGRDVHLRQVVRRRPVAAAGLGAHRPAAGLGLRAMSR